MYHRVKVCPWLVIPVRILQCTFPDVATSAGQVPMSSLCSDYPELFLTRVPGLLLWKTAKVPWNCRCSVAFRSAVPNLDAFFCIVHSELRSGWGYQPFHFRTKPCICICRASSGG